MYRRLLIGCFFVLIGLVRTTPVNAQFLDSPTDTEISFESYSVNKGFYGWRSNGAVQDLNGYLWIASRNGLYRFDGYELIDWTTDKTDSTTVFTSWIGAGIIEVDQEGIIWLGEANGLERFDPVTNEVTRYMHDPDDATTISGNNIRAFLQDSNGKYWVATTRGLDQLDATTGDFSRVTYWGDDESNRPAGVINTIMGDRQGNIWVATALPDTTWLVLNPDAQQHALTKWNPETGAVQHFTLPARNGSAAKQVTALMEDSKGQIWIGTWGDDGLYRYDPAHEIIEHLPYDPAHPLQLSAPRQQDEILVNDDPLGIGINFIFEDSKGYIWIGAFLGGVNRYDPTSGQMLHFEHHPGDPASLIDDSVQEMIETRDGTKWIFTWNGISKIKDLKSRFRSFLSDPADPELTNSLLVTSMIFDSREDLWIGTSWNGIKHISRETGTVTHYHSNSAPESRLSYDFALDVYERPSEPDVRWIGTVAGLNRLNLKTGEIENFSHNPSARKILTSEAVTPMLDDPEGGLWIGGWGGGLRHCDIDEDTCVYYRPSSKPDSLGNGLIMYLYFDHAETLWIGTRDGGLYERMIDERGRVSFKGHISKRVTVTSIYETADHRLWVGTNNGLYVRVADGAWQRLTIEDGLQNNTVCHILPHTDSELWISTLSGVSYLDINQMVFRNYLIEEPLSKTYIYSKASATDKQGAIYIGGNNGYIAFDPAAVKQRDNQISPQVVIEDVILADSLSIFESIASSASAGLTLTANENNIDFYFAGLHFESPEQITYRYKLDGINDDWVEAGTERIARYVDLKPDAYTFRVRAANPDGYWSEEKQLVFTIAPPLWRTNWAYFAYFCLLALGLLTFNRLQRRRLITKEREAARIREAELLAEAADERAQMAEHLDEVKSRFFVNLSHEFRTPLTLILGPLRDALDGAYGKIEGRFSQRLESMQRNGHRLHRLINQLLDLAKLEAGGMHLRARETDLVAFTRILTLSFSSRAERENKTLQFESDVETLPVYIDRDKMERIVFNLLSNAFKFTPAHGKIRVMVRQVDKSAVVEVKDTGQGIPAEDLSLIFDRFHQADTSATRVHEGSGIGLSLVKELVELHAGTIDVVSDPGFGSTFTVTLPLGKDHLQAEDLYDAAPESNEENWQEEDLDEVVQAIAEVTEAEAGAPTILIVEDNPDVRDYLKSHLSSQYHVIEAADGEAGLKMALDTKPDLVISDVMMPKMDGYALCAALKQDKLTSDIPVVLLTARAAEENKLEGLEVGADDYIYKPFSARELLVRTENLITLRRRLRNRYRGELVLKPTEKAVSSVDAVFLEQVRDVIEARMEDASFGVGELADEMALSRRQLQRRIREASELTASGFIRMMRIERAGQLLKQKAGNVSDVAYRVGFRDPRHFSKVFQQLQGKSPREWAEAESE